MSQLHEYETISMSFRKNGYYQTDYISQLPDGLIDKTIEEIAEYIFNNVYRQPYPAKFHNLAPKAKAKFLLNNPTKYKTGTALTTGKIERTGHGVQHVSRVAINTIIFLNMYEQYGNKKTRDSIAEYKKDKYFLKYLMIAALYHDAGRHGEGNDLAEWEKEGSEECEAFLVKLGCSTVFAKEISEAAELKDERFSPEKSILKKVIQCGDCLDIQRVPSIKNTLRNLRSRYINRPRTRPFGVNYLDIWRDATVDKDSIIEGDKVALQKAIIEMALMSRSWIAGQHDLNNACPLEVRINGKRIVVSPGIKQNYSLSKKQKYEHGGLSEIKETLHMQPELGKWCPELYAYQPGNSAHVSIEEYLKPLQDVIDKREQVDQVTAALINLKVQLAEELKAKYALHVKANTAIQKADLSKTGLATIPQDITNLMISLNNTNLPRQDKLKQIHIARKQLEPALRSKSSKIKAAVTFVLVASVCCVIGAAIGLVLGGLPGAGIGALAGLGVGLTFGATAAHTSMWRHKHDAGVREAVNQVLDTSVQSLKKRR